MINRDGNSPRPSAFPQEIYVWLENVDYVISYVYDTFYKIYKLFLKNWLKKLLKVHNPFLRGTFLNLGLKQLCIFR